MYTSSHLYYSRVAPSGARVCTPRAPPPHPPPKNNNLSLSYSVPLSPWRISSFVHGTRTHYQWSFSFACGSFARIWKLRLQSPDIRPRNVGVVADVGLGSFCFVDFRSCWMSQPPPTPHPPPPTTLRVKLTHNQFIFILFYFSRTNCWGRIYFSQSHVFLSVHSLPLPPPPPHTVFVHLLLVCCL